jgi:hypothetical protein
VNDLLLRWRSEKTGRIVSLVRPGSPVRIESLDGALEGQTVTVLRIPERAIQRVLLRLRRGRLGYPETRLVFDQAGEAGVLSETWDAAQAPPPYKPSRYVAVHQDGLVSGPLTVTDPVDVQVHTSVGGKLGVNGMALGAAAGLPISTAAGMNGGRKVRLSATAFGSSDPPVRAVWMTTGQGGTPIQDFLVPYLYEVARPFLLPSNLREVFEEEYRACFESPGEINVEVSPGAFEIGEDQTVEIGLDLFAGAPGSTMAALCLVDEEEGTLLAASDLMVLTVTEEGMVFAEI